MAHAASTVLLCAIGDDVQLLALAILAIVGRYTFYAPIYNAD